MSRRRATEYREFDIFVCETYSTWLLLDGVAESELDWLCCYSVPGSFYPKTPANMSDDEEYS